MFWLLTRLSATWHKVFPKRFADRQHGLILFSLGRCTHLRPRCSRKFHTYQIFMFLNHPKLLTPLPSTICYSRDANIVKAVWCVHFRLALFGSEICFHFGYVRCCLALIFRWASWGQLMGVGVGLEFIMNHCHCHAECISWRVSKILWTSDVSFTSCSVWQL